MSIVVVGLSHRTAPVETRERLAFSEVTIPETLQRLRTAGLAEEAVILSTCNRVEIYAATVTPAPAVLSSLQQFLLNTHALAEPLEGPFTPWPNRKASSICSG